MNIDQIQLVLKKKSLDSNIKFQTILDVKRGYNLGLAGFPFKIKSEELSPLIKKYLIIAKCDDDLPMMNRYNKELLKNY